MDINKSCIKYAWHGWRKHTCRHQGHDLHAKGGQGNKQYGSACCDKCNLNPAHPCNHNCSQSILEQPKSVIYNPAHIDIINNRNSCRRCAL